MSFPRFFCQTPLAANQTIDLPEALTHHALRVLRLKNNSQITLFDGLGGQYNAKLLINGKHAQAQLDEKHTPERELAGEITLVQGLASGDKMDWIIEKSVELGVSHIVPIAARRSVLQLTPERLQKRLKHWEKIIQSACEQCGRNLLPTISPTVSLAQYLAGTQQPGLTLLCHPQASQSLAQALTTDTNRITLLVGPEGGWSDEEQHAAAQAGALPVIFGPRVLRTETAGLAMVAAISALKGWN